MTRKIRSKRYIGKTGIRKTAGKQPKPYWKKVIHSQNEIQWFHPATWKRIRQAAVIGGAVIGIGIYGPKLLDIFLGSAVTKLFWNEISEFFSDIKGIFK